MKLAHAEGFDRSSSLPSMNRECTGWYPKHIEDVDLSGNPIIRKRLFGTPGLSQLATTGGASEINRGSHVMAGIAYFVNGTLFRRFNEDESISSIDTVNGSGKVSMADNGIQLMILVPGGDGFIYNHVTDTFVTITDPDFKANGLPQTVDFINAVFMVTTDSKKFITSDVNDGTSWNPLFFGTAESDPDKIVGLTNYKSQAYIGGSETFEAFNDIGGQDFGYVSNGLFLDKGLFARFSIVNTSDTFMFIGGSVNEDPSIWSFQGNSLVRVSNTGIDLILNSLTTTQLDEVVGYTYAQDHSTFVAWELPNETIVYGLDTGKWHKRQSQVPDSAGSTITIGWRATALIMAYGKLICFDTQDGRIGEVSRDFFDEYGTEIQRTFDVSPIRNEKAAFSVPRLEISMEAGVGDANTPDPQIRLDRSKDAKTFVSKGTRSIGAQGKFNKRTVWRLGGLFKQYALFRFRFSEKVKPVVIRVDATIVGGRE